MSYYIIVGPVLLQRVEKTCLRGVLQRLEGKGEQGIKALVRVGVFTSCSCSSSCLRVTCSASRSAYCCFRVWFSSSTTSPHSAARIFSRVASPSSCVSRSTSDRYCSTVSPRSPPPAAIAFAPNLIAPFSLLLRCRVTGRSREVDASNQTSTPNRFLVLTDLNHNIDRYTDIPALL